MENLLSNAALYSPEGAEIRVTAAARGAWAVLTVENTGARIPAEALPHLFEAFYRAEPSRSRATGGSGLGLYLVRMIVERHGGTCRIENSADGVCFTALRASTENTFSSPPRGPVSLGRTQTRKDAEPCKLPCKN